MDPVEMLWALLRAYKIDTDQGLPADGTTATPIIAAGKHRPWNNNLGAELKYVLAAIRKDSYVQGVKDTLEKVRRGEIL